jgi:hypothetical protein
MEYFVMLKRAAVATLPVIALFFPCAASRAQSAQTYALTIYNDTTDVTIYPVISTPTNGTDQWLQAAFAVPDPATSSRKYAHGLVYRIYVNYPTGIAPGGHVTVNLPFWSQLVSSTDGTQPDGTQPDQYIDWWNGNRVSIYDSDRQVPGQPPAALKQDYTADQATPVKTVSEMPRLECPNCNEQVSIFAGSVALPSNDPDQLTEYTLSGIDPLTNPYKLLTRFEADYDISYVDHAYLPVAMGPQFPSGKTDIGYIGSAQQVPQFRAVLGQFLTDYPGWPRYLDASRGKPGKPFLKLPGAYNTIKAIPDDQGSLIEEPGAAVTKMKDLWTSCMLTTKTSDVCTKIRDVRGLFMANYANYYSLVQAGNCKPPYKVGSLPDLNDLLAHMYGWVQWNEYCTAGAAANDLSQTSGYAGQKYLGIHSEYIKLQYTSLTAAPTETFNPYVKLIHGQTYLNMPGSYAFSIDDDVGNMQVANATGVIITVGGTNGLENQDPYNPATAINVSLGDPNALKRPQWTDYGICGNTADRQFSTGQLAFQVAVPPSAFPCQVTLTDAQKRTYKFTIKQEPPYPPIPSATPIADCSAPTSSTVPGDNWCVSVQAKTNPPENYIPKSYVEAGPPVPYP